MQKSIGRKPAQPVKAGRYIGGDYKRMAAGSSSRTGEEPSVCAVETQPVAAAGMRRAAVQAVERRWYKNGETATRAAENEVLAKEEGEPHGHMLYA